MKKNNEILLSSKYMENEKYLKKMIFNRIQESMRKWNLSVKKIADICYVEDGMVSNWFSRKTVPMSLLYQLHKECGVDLNCLICGDESAFSFSPEDLETLKEACKILRNAINESEANSSQNEG